MEIKGIRCSVCLSSQTYLKLSTGERVCRSCGHIEKIKIEEKDGDKKS
jgi:hypothetical protein